MLRRGKMRYAFSDLEHALCPGRRPSSFIAEVLPSSFERPLSLAGTDLPVNLVPHPVSARSQRPRRPSAAPPLEPSRLDSAEQHDQERDDEKGWGNSTHHVRAQQAEHPKKDERTSDSPRHVVSFRETALSVACFMPCQATIHTRLDSSPNYIQMA